MAVPRRRRWLGALALAGALASAGCRGGAEGDLAAFCDLATDQAQLGNVFEDLHPDDVEPALETFRSVRETQDRLRDLAPEAARADVEIVLSFVDSVVEGLEASDPASPDPPDVYAELRPRFDEVEAASRRLTTYVDSNCG